MSDPNDKEIPEKYITPVNSLIEIMKPKMDKLDKISIKFIENYFEDIDTVSELIESHTINGEIPDSIINKLSESLYGRLPDELTDGEQIIIKVLACYICIQN